MKSNNCQSHGEKNLWMGLILFVIGAVFLLQIFDLIPQETWTYLWPSILVVVGLKLMIVGGCECCHGNCQAPTESKATRKSPARKSQRSKKK